MARAGRLLALFGRFWWDFLVGEAPLLFLGALAVVALALALHHMCALAVVLMPLVALLFLGLSTYHGRERV